MFSSILYIFATVLLLVSFLLIKKTSKKQNILLWICFSIILLFCYNSIIVYLFSLINLKSTLTNLSVFNILLSAFLIIKFVLKKDRQKYFIQTKDIITLIIMVLVVIVFGYLRFGRDIEVVYETCDPATHFWTSMEFFRNSELLNADNSAIDFSTRVFGSYVNAGLTLKVAYPFVGYIDLYVIYIFYDLFMLMMSGLMFYFLISHICKKTNYLIVFIGTLLYLLGYPLNNVLFGFFYSGHNVTVISSLILLMNIMKNDDIKENLGIFLIMILNTGVCFTYYFYAPITTLAIILYFIYNERKKTKMFNKTLIFKLFMTCGIPFLLCMFYFIIPHLDNRQYSILYQLTLDGYFYNSGLSNFILFLPFIIYYCYINIKSKKLDFETFLTFTVFLVIILFIMLVIFDIAVPYYLSKYSYVLWLICFVVIFKLFNSEILKKNLSTVIYICFLILSINSMFNLEKKFLHKNKDLWNMRESTNLLDVYSFNFDKIKTGNIHLTKAEIDIIRKLYSIGATNVVNNYVDSFVNHKLWINAFFWDEKLNCGENTVYTCLQNGVFFDPMENESYEKINDNYNYFVIFYRDVSDEKYMNYKDVIPFEIQKRWDENFRKNYVINRKNLYDEISRDSCEGCSFIDFEDGVIIIK